MVGVLVGAGVGVKVAVGGGTVGAGVLVLLFTKAAAPEQPVNTKRNKMTKYR